MLNGLVLHEHTPIRKDNEIGCSSCGMVLGDIPDDVRVTPDTIIGGEYAYPGLNTLMVGLALERSMNWHFQKNSKLRDYQNLLNNFKDLCKKENLPEYVAFETMKRLLKKKRGLYSYRLQIRELLDVLQDDNRLVFKVRLIKSKYEMASSI